MGHSWSSRRRHNHHHNLQPRNQNPSLPQSRPTPPSSNPSVTVSPQSSSSPAPVPPPPSFAFAANAPYPSPPPSIFSPSDPHFFNVQSNASRPMMGQLNFDHPPYFSHPNTGRVPFRPPVFVDHPKKMNNYVNVHKDSIRVEVDEKNKDCYLISFTFNAIVDGSISIFYFAKEGVNCNFSPLYPEIHTPVRITFQKGLGQKFHQPSGTGLDLSRLDMDDVSKPYHGDVFPLVICAESCMPSMDEQLDEPPSITSPNAQITQAVLEKNNDGHFLVKVINQILWANGVRYELHKIYGINNSDEMATKDHELGKECVICMTDLKDTAVLPCRHMCLCSSCAKELRFLSDKCPICREPIEELLEIKANEANN